MKKKGINIIAILAIVLTVVIVGVVLLFLLSSSEDNLNIQNNGGLGSLDFSGSVLKIESIDQFREFAESNRYECYIGEDKSGGSIYNASLLGEEAVVTYYFDNQGKTMDLRAFFFFNANVSDAENMKIEEITTEQLSVSARDIVERFCLMFGCGSVPDLYLTNNDGTFTLVENDANFQSVADGNSDLVFSIREENGYFWELTISVDDGLASANIRKYFNLEESKGYIANISLYEGE